MAIKTVNELGEMVVSDDVIASIAGIAAIGCAGIVGMAAVRASDGLAELLKRENLARGVKVNAQGDRINIDLFVIVEYGVSMVAVANNVIDAVRYNVENMTGVSVDAVNVCVQGVRV